MKTFFSILILFVSTLTVLGQNNSPNAPIFKFVEETHNFGDIKEGSDAVYEFVFTNVGKEPLIIQDCKASCGCTTPDWSKAPVLPGQKGTISVKYDTKGRSGTFNKSIFIASNAKGKDPKEKRYEIIITGNVIGAKGATPSKASPASTH
jgi:hypothetical protein